jgi:xanthine/CO dehydrogenase XdhC/CoxF family maturation factor/CTP:molybdopterin cytidylyltransferase MocA
MANELPMFQEHPQDVLSALLAWHDNGQRTALIVITETKGGAVRSTGALMAVSETGASAGYVSGGCIDEDVKLQAQAAIRSGKAKALLYGAGSPFTDLPLPCGGAISVLIIPNPDIDTLESMHQQLNDRRSVTVSFSDQGEIKLRQRDTRTYTYTPKLRLRIAGRGADCLALGKLANASGIDVTLQLTADTDIAAAKSAQLTDIQKLDTPTALPKAHDDPWTAFVLMFHDSDWETGLLRQALSGQAFYVGAVGSQITHERRCLALLDAGTPQAEVQRVRGPIGVIPSMRDASMLAISTLAEIVGAYHDTLVTNSAKTAVILLAAGASSRFEAGDKLLAELGGAPVLQRSSKLQSLSDGSNLAVIGPEQPARAELLRKGGWTVFENPNAKTGQASSLKTGLKHVPRDADQILILLADMPLVPDAHINALIAAMQPGIEAVMTESDGTLMPPAIFSKAQIADLMAVEGDMGAKGVFKTLRNTRTVQLDPTKAMDIDAVADLERAQELING